MKHLYFWNPLMVFRWLYLQCMKTWMYRGWVPARRTITWWISMHRTGPVSCRIKEWGQCILSGHQSGTSTGAIPTIVRRWKKKIKIRFCSFYKAWPRSSITGWGLLHWFQMLFLFAIHNTCAYAHLCVCAHVRMFTCVGNWKIKLLWIRSHLFLELCNCFFFTGLVLLYVYMHSIPWLYAYLCWPRGHKASDIHMPCIPLLYCTGAPH